MVWSAVDRQAVDGTFTVCGGRQAGGKAQVGVLSRPPAGSALTATSLMSGIRARQTTVADAVEAFLSERDLRPQARRTYGFCLHRLVDRAGHQPVNRLQPRTLRGFLDTPTTGTPRRPPGTSTSPPSAASSPTAPGKAGRAQTRPPGSAAATNAATPTCGSSPPINSNGCGADATFRRVTKPCGGSCSTPRCAPKKPSASTSKTSTRPPRPPSSSAKAANCARVGSLTPPHWLFPLLLKPPTLAACSASCRVPWAGYGSQPWGSR